MVLDRDEVTRALRNRALLVEGRPKQGVFFPPKAIDVILQVGAVMCYHYERPGRQRSIEFDRIAIGLSVVRIVRRNRGATRQERDEGYERNQRHERIAGRRRGIDTAHQRYKAREQSADDQSAERQKRIEII